MEFLHDGRPPVVREAVYDAAGRRAAATADRCSGDYDRRLLTRFSAR